MVNQKHMNSEGTTKDHQSTSDVSTTWSGTESGIVDIEKIIAQVRLEIEYKGYTREMLSFEDVKPRGDGIGLISKEYDILQMLSANQTMNETYQSQLELPLQSGRRGIGKFIALAQRIVRKCIRFYIKPLAMNQEVFNSSTTRFANQISNYLAEYNHGEKAVLNLETRLDRLVKKDFVFLLQEVTANRRLSEQTLEELEGMRKATLHLEEEYRLLHSKLELLELKLEKERMTTKAGGDL